MLTPSLKTANMLTMNTFFRFFNFSGKATSKSSLSSRWVCLSKNLVLQYILESLSSLLFHSLMSEWIADHFCWPFLSRLFPTNQNKAGQKRREEKCGGKQCAKKLVSNFHSLISEWKRRDDKLSSIYWRTRFLLRHTQPDDRLGQKPLKIWLIVDWSSRLRLAQK